MELLLFGVIVLTVYKLLKKPEPKKKPAFSATILRDFTSKQKDEKQLLVKKTDSKQDRLYLKDIPIIIEGGYNRLPFGAQCAVRYIFTFCQIFNKLDLWKIKILQQKLAGYDETGLLAWGLVKGTVEGIMKAVGKGDVIGAACAVVASVVTSIINLCNQVEENEKQRKYLGQVWKYVTDILGPPPIELCHYLQARFPKPCYTINDRDNPWQETIFEQLIRCAALMEKEKLFVGNIEPIDRIELFKLQEDKRVSLAGGRNPDALMINLDPPKPELSTLTGTYTKEYLEKFSAFNAQFWGCFTTANRYGLQWREYAFHPAALLSLCFINYRAEKKQLDFYKWYAITKAKVELPFAYPWALLQSSFVQAEYKGSTMLGFVVGNDPTTGMEDVSTPRDVWEKRIILHLEQNRYCWLITDPLEV